MKTLAAIFCSFPIDPSSTGGMAVAIRAAGGLSGGQVGGRQRHCLHRPPCGIYRCRYLVSVVGCRWPALFALYRWLSQRGAFLFGGKDAVILGDSINNTGLSDSADVSIASGATLQLDYPALNPDTIDELWLGGVQKSPGTYNSSNSGGLITGTGSLVVQNGPSADPFANWMTTNYPAILTPDNEPGADPTTTASPTSWNTSCKAEIPRFPPPAPCRP